VVGEEGKAPEAAGGEVLLTVAVPPATAAKLVHGSQTGVLYAALRGTDTKAEVGQTVTDSSLFNK
jgi:pilus assembly protein CpaB